MNSESLVRRLEWSTSSYNCPIFNNCPNKCVDGSGCNCRYPEGVDADKNCLVCHGSYTGGQDVINVILKMIILKLIIIIHVDNVKKYLDMNVCFVVILMDVNNV